MFADHRPGPSVWTAISGSASRMLAARLPTQSVRKVSPRPLVSFTFDDAPASSYREGAAILEAHGIRGTYFVCAGGWGAVGSDGPLAGADDVAALMARGHEIGCHTYSRCAVSTVSRRELAADLDRNRDAIIGVGAGVAPPRNFAFPYGDISFGTKRYLGRRFDSCRSSRPGLNAGECLDQPRQDHQADRRNRAPAGMADLQQPWHRSDAGPVRDNARPVRLRRRRSEVCGLSGGHHRRRTSHRQGRSRRIRSPKRHRGACPGDLDIKARGSFQPRSPA